MGNTKDNWFYIKNFKMNSLFWRTFLIISLLLVVPFTSLGVVFYANTYNTLKDEIVLENSSMLDGTKNVIENTLNECDMMSSYIAINDSMQGFMLGTQTSESFRDLTKLATTIPLIYKYIDSVYIYSEINDSVFVGEKNMPMNELSDTGWIDGYKELDSRRGSIVPREKNNSYPPLLTIIKPIYVADERKGAVIMNINCQTLYRSLVSNRYKNGQEFFLADSQNRILLARDVSYFGRSIDELECLPSDIDMKDGTNNQIETRTGSTVLYHSSNTFGFTYISSYPISLYSDRLAKMKWHIFFISIALLAFGFILAYIVSVKSYTPLREIISFLDKTVPVEDMTTKDKNELIYIINSIRLHIEDKEKMKEILEERMKMLKKSQYAMLQAQINPHFLYNTLETINWMAYNLSNSDNPVSAALVNLASFFRNTLSSSGYLISIGEEIKYTKDYLKILELRYGDLFDIVWDIDDSILSYTIIKICLQPIIENAVYHGFKPKGGKGLLTISGSLSGKNIVLTVRDNGVGMDEATVKSLNRRLREDAYTESNHIGIMNVNMRIKIIFGMEYGINVESHLGKGTTVNITIPKTK